MGLVFPITLSTDDVVKNKYLEIVKQITDNWDVIQSQTTSTRDKFFESGESAEKPPANRNKLGSAEKTSAQEKDASPEEEYDTEYDPYSSGEDETKENGEKIFS